jgi:hypothetical protein
MKLFSKASLAFKKQKASNKVAFGTNVINALTALLTASKKSKAILPELPVPLADLLIINTDLAAAISDSLTGNHTAKATLKNAVIAWNQAFTQTANFISTAAAGDAVLIRQAGFVPTKSETSPSQKPGPVTGFKATINGSKGAIMAGTKIPVPGGKAFMFCALPDGAVTSYAGETMIITIAGKSIYIKVSTSRQIELYDLPSAMPFNVSMYAVNNAGSGPATAGQVVIPQ